MYNIKAGQGQLPSSTKHKQGRPMMKFPSSLSRNKQLSAYSQREGLSRSFIGRKQSKYSVLGQIQNQSAGKLPGIHSKLGLNRSSVTPTSRNTRFGTSTYDSASRTRNDANRSGLTFRTQEMNHQVQRNNVILRIVDMKKANGQLSKEMTSKKGKVDTALLLNDVER